MKLEEVKNGYSAAAPRYDKLLHFWFGTVLRIERYRKKAIELLNLREGDSVLDIGCGTGVNFPYLEDKIGESGRIVGVDYTGAMLAEARKKIDERGWKNITLKQGDAVHIDDFVTEKVDAVLSTYCFGILYDAKAAFENALGVLKRGGRIVILDFGMVRPHKTFPRLFYPLYARLVRKYGISSAEDLEQDGFKQRVEQWQAVAQKNLTNIAQQEFLFGMGLLYGGVKA